MPFTEEDKILINNLFYLKGLNGKHLIREFPSKSWNVSLVYQCCCKSYGLLGGSTIVLVAADDAVPANDLVDELVLHKNGQAKNNICTLYLILWPYCLQKKFIKTG